MKKETLAQVFSCEFCKSFKNAFFYRTSLLAASGDSLWSIPESFLQRLFLISKLSTLIWKALFVLTSKWHLSALRFVKLSLNGDGRKKEICEIVIFFVIEKNYFLWKSQVARLIFAFGEKTNCYLIFFNHFLFFVFFILFFCCFFCFCFFTFFCFLEKSCSSKRRN